MRSFKVIRYINVKQSDDGFWSVETDTLDDIIQIGSKTKPKDICNELVEIGLLESSNMRSLYLTDTSKDIIEVKEKKGLKPICRLQRVFS